MALEIAWPSFFLGVGAGAFGILTLRAFDPDDEIDSFADPDE